MKKFVIFFALIALFGCEKTDQPKKDTIVGSIWVANWGTDNYPILRAIEFTSETGVKAYSTDEYLGEFYPNSGTYTKSGNTITFNGLSIYNTTEYIATMGTISNDFLTVNFTHYNKTFDTTTEHTYRFQKKR